MRHVYFHLVYLRRALFFFQRDLFYVAEDGMQTFSSTAPTGVISIPPEEAPLIVLPSFTLADCPVGYILSCSGHYTPYRLPPFPTSLIAPPPLSSEWTYLPTPPPCPSRSQIYPSRLRKCRFTPSQPFSVIRISPPPQTAVHLSSRLFQVLRYGSQGMNLTPFFLQHLSQAKINQFASPLLAPFAYFCNVPSKRTPPLSCEQSESQRHVCFFQNRPT